MTLNKILASCLAFAAAGSVAMATVPSKHDVMTAISIIEKKVSGPEAEAAAKTIVTYAQLSDDVMVDIGPDQLPWLDEDWGLEAEKEQACKSILLASFVAGNVKSQIKNDKAEDDTYSGWIFTIDIYNRLKAKESFKSESIDSLAKMRADGTLLQHAREVQVKGEQDDQQQVEKKPLA